MANQKNHSKNTKNDQKNTLFKETRKKKEVFFAIKK